VILFPPAKINLGLRILRKRSDGFHDIETVMLPLPFFDILELLPADKFTFLSTGLEVKAVPGSNLCEKAFRLMKEQHGIPDVYIHLRKQIPMGAGLGGGSADATCTLMGLNALFQLNLSQHTLHDYASNLGSDCPFFLEDAPQIATGRGEILSFVNLTLVGKYLVLLNPGIHVGTKEAYAGVYPNEDSKAVKSIIEQPLETWKGELVNDFEKSVFAQFPAIETLKQRLYDLGAVYAAMSGSGSSVFGIMEKEVDIPQDLTKYVVFSGYFTK
jgi:4-diphosphocytidyl-2-C-methyl-D-erythritol kinase